MELGQHFSARQFSTVSGTVDVTCFLRRLGWPTKFGISKLEEILSLEENFWGKSGRKYGELIDALDDTLQTHREIESQMTFEDGRVGNVKADLKIKEVEMVWNILAN